MAPSPSPFAIHSLRPGHEDVEVQAVLARLALRHTLEVEHRKPAGGSVCTQSAVELVLDAIAEEVGPERRHERRVAHVEADLDRDAGWGRVGRSGLRHLHAALAVGLDLVADDQVQALSEAEDADVDDRQDDGERGRARLRP